MAGWLLPLAIFWGVGLFAISRAHDGTGRSAEAEEVYEARQPVAIATTGRLPLHEHRPEAYAAAVRLLPPEPRWEYFTRQPIAAAGIPASHPRTFFDRVSYRTTGPPPL